VGAVGTGGGGVEGMTTVGARAAIGAALDFTLLVLLELRKSFSKGFVFGASLFTPAATFLVAGD
jgi:hypothetical protein